MVGEEARNYTFTFEVSRREIVFRYLFSFSVETRKLETPFTFLNRKLCPRHVRRFTQIINVYFSSLNSPAFLAAYRLA